MNFALFLFNFWIEFTKFAASFLQVLNLIVNFYKKFVKMYFL